MHLGTWSIIWLLLVFQSQNSSMFKQLWGCRLGLIAIFLNVFIRHRSTQLPDPSRLLISLRVEGAVATKITQAKWRTTQWVPGVCWTLGRWMGKHKIKEYASWAREMAQPGESLLHKPVGLSWDLQHSLNIWMWWFHHCDLKTREAEGGGCLDLGGQPV